jgi:xanthine dehydrogenase accessory factor
MIRPELARRADALAADRVPFVTATVVRAQRPASVRPGDTALVLGDGTIEGFVGGACGESSVRMHALRALETGEAILLRIVPGDGESPAQEGAVTVENPCLSGGALEIFLEPRFPAPRIAVVGDTPIALALADVGERVGYDVELHAGGDLELSDTAAVVVASHGRDEEGALAAAMKAGVPYVGLVASRERGSAVVDALREAGLAEDRLARLHTPAGLDIGARSPEEIALAILAEIVATRERPPAAAPPPAAVDPVCGMEVAAIPSTAHVDHEGARIYFCSEGCRFAFLEDPARHAGSR